MSEQRDPFKEMVIDAICGAGFSSRQQAVQFERRRLAKFEFIADSEGDRWVWDRGQLAYMESAQLQELYQDLKQTQWAQEREFAARTIVDLLKKAGPTSELPTK